MMETLANTHLWAVYEALEANPTAYQVKPLRAWNRLVGVGIFLLCLQVLNTAWATQIAYVTTPSGYALNARWGPGTNYGVHRKLVRASAIELTGRYENGWAQLTNGTWVAGNFIQLAGGGSVPGGGGSSPVINSRYAVISTPAGYALNARWGPGTTYGVHQKIRRGTTVELSGRHENGWVQLINATWVAAEYLTPVAIPPASSAPTTTAPQTVPQTTPAPAVDPVILDAQNRLRSLNYLPSSHVPTGVYDAQTEQAVRSFQRVNGLTEDGILGPATLQLLYDSTVPATTSTPAPTPIPTVTVTVTPTPQPTPQTTTTPQPLPPFTTTSPLPTQSPSPSPTVGTTQSYRVVTGDGQPAMVFRGPGTEYGEAGSIAENTIVTTTGKVTGNWTELSDRRWIFSMWLQPVQ